MRNLMAGLAASALIGGPVLAFGTINGLGQSAEHERITRAALGDLGPATLDALAGKKGTFGAVGAPDRPGRGLLSQSQAHCDNGDYLSGDMARSGNYPHKEGDARASITACRAFIMIHLEKAVAAAAGLAEPTVREAALDCSFDGEDEGSAKCRVLDAFGAALHAAQDFYSHSNWTDRPVEGVLTAENPPGLGQEGRAPFLDPRLDAPFPDGLITGCFKAKPEGAFCNYGGLGPIGSKKRVKHGFLNKDTGPIGPQGATGPGTSPRGKVNGNFERAVAAAIEDTADKWAYFEERLIANHGDEAGMRITCVMRDDDPRQCPALLSKLDALVPEEARLLAEIRENLALKRSIVSDYETLAESMSALDSEIARLNEFCTGQFSEQEYNRRKSICATEGQVLNQRRAEVAAQRAELENREKVRTGEARSLTEAHAGLKQRAKIIINGLKQIPSLEELAIRCEVAPSLAEQSKCLHAGYEAFP